MAKVSLLINDFGDKKKQAISIIRQFTSLPISEILSRSNTGIPLFEIDMFGMDLAERVADFQIFIENLTGIGISWEMYELMSDEDFSKVEKGSLVKVDLNMLMNMLKAQKQDHWH